MSNPQIIYCHCAYANVVPREVKEAVLRKLCEANVPFEAVADLCESSARRDSSLERLVQSGQIKIAACYPRAVKWLFAAAQAPLDEVSSEILNMRVQSADEIIERLLQPDLKPNLPTRQESGPTANQSAPL